MPPLTPSAARSLRRSRLRRALLLALADLQEGYLAEVAAAAGMRSADALACLVGREPDYRVDLALIELGLVEARGRDGGRVFRITPAGLALAQALRLTDSPVARALAAVA